MSERDNTMFVCFGFDDNALVGREGQRPIGISWVLEAFSKRGGSASFYMTSQNLTQNEYGLSEAVAAELKRAVAMGFEIGNHTHTHPSGRKFSVEDWKAEIIECEKNLAEKVFDRPWSREAVDRIRQETRCLAGFRAPFLDYNDNAFTAARALGYEYDCSIEEGFQPEMDGRNYLSPYHLDEGSPGHNALSHLVYYPLGKHPGLWELPLHAVIVPPDSLSEKYGFKKGFRKKMAQVQPYFNEADGKITGLDWNMFVAFQMTKEEYLATMKYTFDLRMEGNRAPMMYGVHSDIYSPQYKGIENISWVERQEAVEEFLDYVRHFYNTRITSLVELMDWLNKQWSQEY